MTKLKVIFLLSSLWTAYAMVASEGEFKKSLAGGEGCSGAPVSIARAASEQDTNAKEMLIAKVEAQVISQALYNSRIFFGASRTDCFIEYEKDGSLKPTIERDYDFAQQICNGSFVAQMQRDKEELATEERQKRLSESIKIVKTHSAKNNSQTDGLTIHYPKLESYNKKQQAALAIIIQKHKEQLIELDKQHATAVEKLHAEAQRAALNKVFFYEEHEKAKPADSNISYHDELQDANIYTNPKKYESELRSIIAKEEAAKNIPQK